MSTFKKNCWDYFWATFEKILLLFISTSGPTAFNHPYLMECVSHNRGGYETVWVNGRYPEMKYRG